MVDGQSTMASATLQERLAKLEGEKRRIEARAASLRARVNQQNRKDDTRRRILLGAFLLNQLARGGNRNDNIKQWVADELPKFLTKERDRQVLAAFLQELGGAAK